MRPDVVDTCSVARIPSIITIGLVQACGGNSDVVARATAAGPIEALCEAVAARPDCMTGASTGTYLCARAMHRAGALSDSNAAPTATRGPGVGI